MVYNQLMKQSVHFLSELINESNDMIFVIRMDDGYIEHVNNTVIQELGYTLEELQVLGIEGVRVPMNPEEASFFEHLDALREAGKLVDHAFVIRKDTTRFPVEARVKHVHYQGHDYDLAFVRDVSEQYEHQKKLEESNENLERMVVERTKALQEQIHLFEDYKEALDASNIVSKSTPDGIITYINDKFVEVSGFSREEAIGKNHRIVRHPDTPHEIFTEMWETICAKKIWKGIIKNRKKNGGYYWVDIIIKPLLDNEGNIEEFIAVRHDITETVDQREAIRKNAQTDLLTGLPNRVKLREEVVKSEAPSVALLNIDGFSHFNDFYGHLFGDRIIMTLAKTIAPLLHETLELYHLHADEFLILNRYMNRPRFISEMADLIRHLNTLSLEINTTSIPVEISGAISFETAGTLLSTADIALKHVKKGQNRLIVYDASLSIADEFEKNILWSGKLKNALENDRLIPYFQPIIDNKGDEKSKFEVLVRMIDEDGKVFTPFHFLDISKRSKQYRHITKRMIKKSFETFKEDGIVFSINLSIDDILDPNLQYYLFDMIREYGVGKRLILELVESEGIENFAQVSHFIEQVKAYGCRIAIDDFGSGYSNFIYLMKLKADYIKIDGSLIRDMDVDLNARAIVQAIVSYAKESGISTIAEFVENETVLNLVKEMGIDFSQGYHFSPPIPDPFAY